MRPARPERPRRRGSVRPSGAAAVLALAALAACTAGDRAARREAELRALADTLLPTLVRLSGLPARGPIEVRRQTADGVADYVESRLALEYAAGELEAVRDAYALFGLLPDTLDLRALILELLVEQVAGYYDPGSRALYVPDNVPRQAARPVMAHELVHALQDQHVPLDSLIARARGNDRRMAAQAAIEGHATLVMYAFLTEEQTGRAVDPTTIADPAVAIRASLEGPGGFPVFRRTPRALREALLFPYTAGTSFVQAVWPALRGADADAFAAMVPASTAQVLRPVDRFLQTRDEPLELRFDAPPPPWVVAWEDNLGAFEAGLALDLDVADTWRGDRYRLLRRTDGAAALEWWSVWATADAAAAAAGRAAALERTGRAAEAEPTSVDGLPALRMLFRPAHVPREAVPAGAVHCVARDGARIACPAAAWTP
jgi:hypothetical protein